MRFLTWLSRAAALCVLAWMPVVACGQGAPIRGDLVVAINSSKGTFDAASFIDAMKRTGLLDNKSLPPKIDNNGDLVGSNGAVVGQKVSRNGRQIGWRNTTTGAIIVDLDRPTGTAPAVDLEDAWQSVNNNGRLVIAKHGTLEGGGIAGSKGSMASKFNGVDSGGGGDAITLTPRANANILVELPSCNSATSNDGKPSVLDALKRIPGVSANSTGETGLFEPYHRLQYIPKQAVRSNDDVDAALDAYRNAQPGGKEAKDFYDWLRTLPAQKQAEALPKTVTVPNPRGPGTVVVNLNWSVTPATRYERTPNPPPGDDFGAMLDRQFRVGPQESVTVAAIDITGYDLGTRLTVHSLTDNDLDPNNEIFLLSRYATTEQTLPPGLTTLSGIVQLFASDGLAENVSITITVPVFVDPDATVQPLMYRFDEATAIWTPLGGTSSIVNGRLITTLTLGTLGNGIDSAGLIIAPLGVPGPSVPAVAAVSIALAIKRRRAASRASVR